MELVIQGRARAGGPVGGDKKFRRGTTALDPSNSSGGANKMSPRRLGHPSTMLVVVDDYTPTLEYLPPSNIGIDRPAIQNGEYLRSSVTLKSTCFICYFLLKMMYLGSSLIFSPMKSHYWLVDFGYLHYVTHLVGRIQESECSSMDFFWSFSSEACTDLAQRGRVQGGNGGDSNKKHCGKKMHCA